MSNFTEKELEYLRSQRLGRIATVNSTGEPHVVPTSFRHNAELDTIDIGGLNIAGTRKYRDVVRDGHAAIVIDDVLPPWQARGIEIRGRAEVVPTGGEKFGNNFAPEIIRIHPTRIISWGIEGDAYHASSRKIEE